MTTLALNGRLDEQVSKSCRDILRHVIAGTLPAEAETERPADVKLARLLWACAMQAARDPRYVPVAKQIEERLWGRVKFEMEHSGPGGGPMESRQYIVELSSGLVLPQEGPTSATAPGDDGV
jgi:hypothetical protein